VRAGQPAKQLVDQRTLWRLVPAGFRVIDSDAKGTQLAFSSLD